VVEYEGIETTRDESLRSTYRGAWIYSVRLFDSPNISSKGENKIMNAPANLKYTKSDEWFDPATGKMGLSDYAQNQLSDIVFVEILVDEGDTIEAGKAIASVESVKASAEIYSPAGGKVVAVNKGLSDKPESINTDPFGEAWMIQLEGGSAGDVMDAAAYEKYCEERAH
jgi:glycine cleavage system H protein